MSEIVGAKCVFQQHGWVREDVYAEAVARAERAEAEAAAMREALEIARTALSRLSVLCAGELPDKQVEAEIERPLGAIRAALASDAGRAMLERLRKLESRARRLLDLLYDGHASLTEHADWAVQELRAALEGDAHA